MFRWLSRKGGVQAGYTRVIDLRHPKMLGSNRASMNSPFFFSLLSLSPFPRLIAAIVLLVRVRCRCVASHRRDPFDRALGFSSVLLPFPISDTSYLISSAATPAWKPFGQYGSDTKRVTVITAVYATSAISDTRLAWVNRPNEASSRRLLSRMRNVTRAESHDLILCYRFRPPRATRPSALRASPSFGRTLGSAHQAAFVCFRNATPKDSNANAEISRIVLENDLTIFLRI